MAILKLTVKNPQGTFSENWVLIKGIEDIKKVEKLGCPEKVNKRYELKDPSLKSDKIPEVIAEIIETDCDGDWYGEYASLQGLYEYKYDKSPVKYETQEFEPELLGEINLENATNINDMRVSVYKTNWKREGEKNIDLSSAVQFSDLERMFTPEFALPVRPCYLTSEQTYKIIRKHVNDNINSAVAVVTSDYDFCFTVKKKITIKPITWKTEIKKSNGRSYAKPRFRSRTHTHKQIEIFEMTHKGKNYGDYTVIEGFKGENFNDLVENIKLCLKELMEYINLPVKECEHCGGTGSIINKNFDKNVRK